MAAPRKGYVEPCTDTKGAIYYRARIHLADGSRPRFRVPDEHAGSEKAAEAWARWLQAEEDAKGEILKAKQAREREKAVAEGATAGAGETCSQYRVRLDAYRKELGRRSGKDDRSTWRGWIEPCLGDLPIAKVTKDDVEKVRDALDEAITLHRRTEGDEGISAKRARNVWVVVTTTFRAA